MAAEGSDETLMVRYQQGEVAAFETLLVRHRGPLFHFIFRFVGNFDIAEELLQEVFLRLIKGARSYQTKAKFTTWLYTIARNLCVDYSRRSKHRRVESLEAPVRAQDSAGGENLLARLAASERDPGAELAVAELRERIQRALAALPHEQREVFLLREILELSFKEIAQVVGVGENTIKSRMRYALQKLRDELADCREAAKVPARK